MRSGYIVHRTDKRLAPVARTFKEFLLGESAGLSRDEPAALRRARR